MFAVISDDSTSILSNCAWCKKKLLYGQLLGNDTIRITGNVGTELHAGRFHVGTEDGLVAHHPNHFVDDVIRALCKQMHLHPPNENANAQAKCLKRFIYYSCSILPCEDSAFGGRVNAY